MFYEYIIEKGYDINDINLGGWISDENDKTISFRNKDWNFIEENLIKAVGNRTFNGLSLYLSPIKTKYINSKGYVPLYKIKKS